MSAIPRNFIAVALEGEMMGWKPEWLEWWWLESVLGNDLSTVIKILFDMQCVRRP